MRRKLAAAGLAAVLSLGLSGTALAQTDNETTVGTEANDGGDNWGWIGLAGLLGLAGLRKDRRDHYDRDRAISRT